MGTDIYIYVFGSLLYSCSCALDCIGIILWDIVLYKCCKVVTGEHLLKKKEMWHEALLMQSNDRRELAEPENLHVYN